MLVLHRYFLLLLRLLRLVAFASVVDSEPRRLILVSLLRGHMMGLREAAVKDKISAQHSRPQKCFFLLRPSWCPVRRNVDCLRFVVIFGDGALGVHVVEIFLLGRRRIELFESLATMATKVGKTMKAFGAGCSKRGKHFHFEE